jgi:iron complex transport system substrate-binding protein
MRICSLLPSATEILFALGLEDSVMGVTHECDFPPAARKKPALIQPRVDPAAPPADINRRVSELLARGENIYAVRDDLLREIEPDLIITQDLCHVCAASPDDLATALSRLKKQPRVLSLSPHTLADVWEDIRRIGAATRTEKAANQLADRLHDEVEILRVAAESAGRHPRVACLEWLDPLFNAGHWVPEMVKCAGGIDVLAQPVKPSVRITSADVIRANPEVIIVMPCGYDAARAAREFRSSPFPREWQYVPAIHNNAVFAVDANSYFSRSGPRLAEGVKILAQIFRSNSTNSEVRSTVCERIMTAA